MTKLECAVFAHPEYLALAPGAANKDKQAVLDNITAEIMGSLSAKDILTDVREVYDETADEYAKNPHTQNVIDELIEFMDMLPENAEVLDLGCATGRDVFFMSIQDQAYRASQMGRLKNGKTTLEKYRVPSKVFRVTGVDHSEHLLLLADIRKNELIKMKLLPECTPTSYPYFTWANIHEIDLVEHCEYDGIWSCAALYTHTPRQLIGPAMESATAAIKPGGILFLSYTNGSVEAKYDKLLLSSTGRIKYFSQPEPAIIWATAKKFGLEMTKESFSDFEINGKIIKKDLFVSQFFKKI